MVSDDTEHAAFTAWALAGQPDLTTFERRLRRAFRRWLWCLPAGIGLATLRAGLKVSLGLTHSGVHSAGNGPLMRAPVLAVAGPPDWLDYLDTSTRLTHTDPRALEGARLVARVTRYLLDQLTWTEVVETTQDPFLLSCLAEIGEFPQDTPEEYASRRGWQSGVSGFVQHTTPIVVLAALRSRDDYRQAVQSVIRCGGDTDTLAAIVGGMVGARVGREGLPAPWLQSFGDWPCTLAYLESLATTPGLPPLLGSLGRNLLFGWSILGYGLRRLLPPY
jgi:ADP-ribosylglycohydrolase